MSDLPTGTVTFLFTDIEGSTALLQQIGDARYGEILAEHRRLLRTAFEEGGGREIDTQGDAFLVAFHRAGDGVRTAVAAQRETNAHPWPSGPSVRVRMALHTGEPTVGTDGYVGLDVHRAARIMSAGHGGQILLSQSTRDLVTTALPEGVTLLDLGEHRLKDLTRPEHIFQVAIAGLPSNFPPLKTLDLVSNNLPIQLTSFIGREREIHEVKRALTETRLLTLTGPGGAGKTRLAIQAAADLIEQFRHGVWLVELAPLVEPAHVVQAIASTLDVREVSGRSLQEMLVDYLQPKTLLLVMDNCEHLVAASAQVANTLLRTCPKLRILTTSREALGVAGEVIFRVPPLSRPDPQRLQSLEELTQFEAVRLFVERGVHSQPRFALSGANASAVAEICHQLDGIPLAIELAAARVKVLTVEQIALRLNDRFRLLSKGTRTGLPHHQTLRAAMDWSYDLLSEDERTLFRRLSVFSGGLTLGAAEAVCAENTFEADDVLDLLSNLVDKSLVVADGLNGDTRYRLLETIRQYGHDKLLESGEAAVIQQKHLDWYLQVAERAEPELQGPNQVGWLEHLEVEHDNLRAALAWNKTSPGDADAGVRLAGTLYRFWSMRGYFSEGREWLEGVLQLSQGQTPVRAKAVYGVGVLAFDQGDYERAQDLWQESLALYRGLGDKLGVASSLNGLALLLRNRGDHARAVALLEESLALCQELGQKGVLAETLYILALTVRRVGDYGRARGLFEESVTLWREIKDKSGLAKSLTGLGVVARFQGDYAWAKTLHEESLALSRELGHNSEIAQALIGLGGVSLDQGDYERARTLCEECLILCRELGYRRGIATSVGNLGMALLHQGHVAQARELVEEAKALWVTLGAKQQIAVCVFTLGITAHAQGDLVGATALFKESLALYREIGDSRGIAECLVWMARVAAAMQQAELGARLLGAADALREAIKAPSPPSDRPIYDLSLAEIRGRLGEEAFAAARAQGQSITLVEAIAEAMGIGGSAMSWES